MIILEERSKKVNFDVKHETNMNETLPELMSCQITIDVHFKAVK